MIRATARDSAFFHVDHTLFRGGSVPLGFRCARRRGGAPLRDLIRTFYWYLRYRVNRVDPGPVSARTIGAVEHRAEKEHRAFCECFVEEAVLPLAPREAVRRGWPLVRSCGRAPRRAPV